MLASCPACCCWCAGPARKPRPAVLFVFGEHAREVITPEVGLWLTRLLLDGNSTIYSWPELSAALDRAEVDAAGHSTTNSTSSTSSSMAKPPGNQQKVDWPAVVRGWVGGILAAVEVVIVPIEAMDSRRLVEAGQLCVRKTSSNVDLNRWGGRVPAPALPEYLCQLVFAPACLCPSIVARSSFPGNLCQSIFPTNARWPWGQPHQHVTVDGCEQLSRWWVV